MKRFVALFLILGLCAGLLAGCAEKETVQDTSPITIFVGLGNGQEYYEALAEAIHDNLGFDVEFRYNQAQDTTTAARLMIKNNDLPADIMITSSATPDEYLSESCLNLLSYTTVTDRFTYSKIKEYTADDGAVYQLPYTSKLIGITYNKTLMEEMGWEVPTSFEDMVELKAKCDEAGILFAVSGGVATGHGFNWLFHTMGSQWLKTLNGTEWLEDYLEGTADVSAFKEQAEYFRKYVEAGLFGEFWDTNWAENEQFKTRRALFMYRITNDTYSYDGPLKDADGNEIPGSEVHDEYAAMPWITDGGSNCFTTYDNMFVCVNKALTADDQQDRLEKVLDILEFMTTKTVTDIFTNMYPDGYVAVNDFEITDDRMYADFKDSITQGYIMPWYYNYFDTDTIVNTGAVLNSYIKGVDGTTFDDVFTELDRNNTNRINAAKSVLGTVTRTFDYEALARFEAVCGAMNLQDMLDESGISEEITVSLMAYAGEEGMYPWIKLGAVNTKMYAGDFEEGHLNTITQLYAKAPCAIRMTGAQINELLENGLDKSEDLNYDATQYGPLDYAVMTKDNIAIEADKTYVVAINEQALTVEQFNSFKEAGAVLLYEETNQSPGTGALDAGIRSYFAQYGTADPDNIIWK